MSHQSRALPLCYRAASYITLLVCALYIIIYLDQRVRFYIGIKR